MRLSNQNTLTNIGKCQNIAFDVKNCVKMLTLGGGEPSQKISNSNLSRQRFREYRCESDIIDKQKAMGFLNQNESLKLY